MSTITISVIIPAYNAVRTINRTLDSVRNQTLLPMEVIVVDDGSIDNTSLMVSDYISHYGLSNWRLLIQKNGGPALARDTAIIAAQGSHIALLDADDVWLPDKLKTSLDLVISNSIDLVGAGIHPSHGNDNFWIIDRRKMLFSNPYFTSTVIFSRSAYFEIGGFDLNQRYSEDYKLWLAFAWNGKRCGKMLRPEAIYRADAVGRHRGLSSHLWRMQKSELKNFQWLYSNKLAPASWCLIAQGVSWIKFIYRLIRSI